MSDLDINADVRAFLRDTIDSHEKLNLVLFAHEHGHILRVAEYAAARALDLILVQQSVVELVGRGVLSGGRDRNEFACRPASAELRKTIEALAAAFDERPLEILKLMNAHALERARDKLSSAFSDAFQRQRRSG